jgi:hypothetical protein
LTTTPHDADLEDERPTYGSTSDGIEETLSRLLGREWHTVWKYGERDGDDQKPQRVASDGEYDEDDDE